jgi:hypothetical protein
LNKNVTPSKKTATTIEPESKSRLKLRDEQVILKNIEEFENVKDSIFRALSQGKEESADTKQNEKDIKKGVKSLKLDLDLNSLAKTMEEIEAHKNVEHNHDEEEEEDNFDI